VKKEVNDAREEPKVSNVTDDDWRKNKRTREKKEGLRGKGKIDSDANEAQTTSQTPRKASGPEKTKKHTRPPRQASTTMKEAKNRGTTPSKKKNKKKAGW